MQWSENVKCCNQPGWQQGRHPSPLFVLYLILSATFISPAFVKKGNGEALNFDLLGSVLMWTQSGDPSNDAINAEQPVAKFGYFSLVN